MADPINPAPPVTMMRMPLSSTRLPLARRPNRAEGACAASHGIFRRTLASAAVPPARGRSRQPPYRIVATARRDDVAPPAQQRGEIDPPVRRPDLDQQQPRQQRLRGGLQKRRQGEVLGTF